MMRTSLHPTHFNFTGNTAFITNKYSLYEIDSSVDVMPEMPWFSQTAPRFRLIIDIPARQDILFFAQTSIAAAADISLCTAIFTASHYIYGPVCCYCLHAKAVSGFVITASWSLLSHDCDLRFFFLVCSVIIMFDQSMITKERKKTECKIELHTNLQQEEKMLNK